MPTADCPRLNEGNGSRRYGFLAVSMHDADQCLVPSAHDAGLNVEDHCRGLIFGPRILNQEFGPDLHENVEFLVQVDAAPAKPQPCHPSVARPQRYLVTVSLRGGRRIETLALFFVALSRQNAWLHEGLEVEGWRRMEHSYGFDEPDYFLTGC